jgi:hypothetical protein
MRQKNGSQRRKRAYFRAELAELALQKPIDLTDLFSFFLRGGSMNSCEMLLLLQAGHSATESLLQKLFGDRIRARASQLTRGFVAVSYDSGAKLNCAFSFAPLVANPFVQRT